MIRLIYIKNIKRLVLNEVDRAEGVIDDTVSSANRAPLAPKESHGWGVPVKNKASA